MSAEQDTAVELEYRIQAEIKAFHGDLPERYALAWHGYLACAQEWGIVDQATYGRLIKLLPNISEPDPIETIFLGREEVA